MPEAQAPQKIPLVFFRTESGGEPVRQWLKELDEVDRHAIGKDLLRAVALASRNAFVPRAWSRLVGGAQHAFEQSHRSRAGVRR